MPPIECSDCVEPPRPPPPVPPQTPVPPYAMGHICTVFESLATPIEHILQATPSIIDNPPALERCQNALAAINTPGSRIGKNRPCIIASSMTASGCAVELWSMGTFGKIPYDRIPRIYQPFLLPVSPNPYKDGVPHFHTNPEWNNQHQWAIVHSFKSTRPLKGLWPRARYPGPASTKGPNGEERFIPSPNTVGNLAVYTISLDTITWLNELERSMLENWSAMCTNDPNHALQCEMEYRASRFRPTADSRRSSVDTCATGSTVRSRKSVRSFMSFRNATPLTPLQEETNVPHSRTGRTTPVHAPSRLVTSSKARGGSKASLRSAGSVGSFLRGVHLGKGRPSANADGTSS
ncbi:hypothetical protein C8Q76DRAFT_791253 [Earliella scabrosa]|nr:hypothetical protein C8Q76DRAFT_791253 [Earliella scabrosa]